MKKFLYLLLMILAVFTLINCPTTPEEEEEDDPPKADVWAGWTVLDAGQVARTGDTYVITPNDSTLRGIANSTDRTNFTLNFTAHNVSSGATFQVRFRYQDDQNYYIMDFNPINGANTLFSYISGAIVQTQSGSTTGVNTGTDATNTFQIVVSGNVITLSINGTQTALLTASTTLGAGPIRIQAAMSGHTCTLSSPSLQ